MTNKKLVWWFNYYDRKFFQGKLPEVYVHFEKLGDIKDGKLIFGVTSYFEDTIILSINSIFKAYPKVTKHTLLHEMAHISLPIQVEHGPKWEARMRSLARRGAFTGLW